MKTLREEFIDLHIELIVDEGKYYNFKYKHILFNKSVHALEYIPESAYFYLDDDLLICNANNFIPFFSRINNKNENPYINDYKKEILPIRNKLLLKRKLDNNLISKGKIVNKI